LATQGENIFKHILLSWINLFLIYKISPKRRKKKKKKREKENEVLFDGWFSIHKSFEFF
jgi:hypothetical protein